MTDSDVNKKFPLLKVINDSFCGYTIAIFIDNKTVIIAFLPSSVKSPVRNFTAEIAKNADILGIRATAIKVDNVMPDIYNFAIKAVCK